MIRRTFWLGAGAAAGIMGYRRVCAAGRRVSGRVTKRAPKSAVGLARESIRFTRDVREGMGIYMARQNGHAASTLKPQRLRRAPDQKDGR